LLRGRTPKLRLPAWQWRSWLAALLLFSLPPPHPQWPGDGPLNVRHAPFLARGDGHTDDWAALQHAIDTAGVPGPSFAKNRAGVGQAVYLPAGVYAISRPLTARSSRKGCDPACKGGPNCVHDCHPPLRLIGDGMELSVITATLPMSSVLVFNGSQPSKGTTAYGSVRNEVTGVKFDAANKANFSVFGAYLVSTRFHASAFHRGLIAGAYLGYGWINDVVDCDVHGNIVAGLICDNQANALNVIDSNFDENGIAVLVNFGALVRIEGNTMEAQTAPGENLPLPLGCSCSFHSCVFLWLLQLSWRTTSRL
jgi:hypothetical protein